MLEPIYCRKARWPYLDRTPIAAPVLVEVRIIGAKIHIQDPGWPVSFVLAGEFLEAES